MILSRKMLKRVGESRHPCRTPTLVLSEWLGRAMVLGSFHCRGVLLLLHMVGQVPAVLVAGAGRVGYFLFIFSSRLSCLPFLMPHL